MSNNTARVVSTVAIWMAITIILTFGVFRMNWNDFVGMTGMILVVTLICVSAAASTLAVWRLSLPDADARVGQPQRNPA
jgi:hypothetical protein